MTGTLTAKEFKLLEQVEAHPGERATQRDLASTTGFSVGSVNKLVSSLSERGLLDKMALTEKGREALEPYRVRRAILIAAGFGERMVPITLNTPKPLVRVRGKRIIDSLLDALEAAGIEDVYIVRGYLGEQFDQLRYRYPNVKFVENEIFNEANNISSALAASGLLENAYVLESDILLANPRLITKYQYESNYLAFPVERTDDWCFLAASGLLENAYVLESDILLANPRLITKYQYESNYLAFPVERTDDWCFYVKHGVIDSLAVGGLNCHQMCGISYWTAEDGRKLAEDIPKVIEMPGGKERYWDEVALRYCKDRYRVAIRECRREDLVEIDTFEDIPKVIEMPGGKERYWDEVALRYCKDRYRVAIRECRREDLVEIDTFRELQELDPSYSV